LAHDPPAGGGDRPIGNHTFRATGITAYLGNGGALEHAQTMAAHESPRTTKLYDRTQDRLLYSEGKGQACPVDDSLLEVDRQFTFLRQLLPA
jgi:hypothetical protein